MMCITSKQAVIDKKMGPRSFITPVCCIIAVYVSDQVGVILQPYGFVH